MIGWAAVPGAARYCLVLTARQPEVGLLARLAGGWRASRQHPLADPAAKLQPFVLVDSEMDTAEEP